LSDTPLFVVVGNVNQGKSSVVAALSENGAIPIDSYPGTTRRSGTYVFRVGERELFRIVDTPGFQRPRQLLAWLRERAPSAADRPRTVRAFVDEHAGTDRFPDEVELLRPILDGAGILYVVDASSRLEPSNEAEMEILRWTGQPAMALINKVRDRDHAEEWRPTLRQFFHIVREFDAHGARFAERVALLRGFREIRPEWAAAIDEAVRAMEGEWAGRKRRAAGVLADLMIAALSHVERRPLPDGADEAAARAGLEEAFRDAQRRLEGRARDEIERIYGHPDLRRDDPALELLREDLFAETTWRALGLTRGQLLGYGAAWGAAAGALIDLAVGGLSIFAGTAIGAGLGAAAGWFGGQTLAQVWPSSSRLARVLLPGETGRFVAMGPVTSARFSWVLLDRALVHCAAVRDRSHARRDALQTGTVGVVAGLPKAQRDAIDAALRGVLKGAARREVGAAERAALAAALEEVLGG
jgi:hypothetical protein